MPGDKQAIDEDQPHTGPPVQHQVSNIAGEAVDNSQQWGMSMLR